MQKAMIVIPARMGSSRFPQKPMALIHQKTMIERVFLIAKSVQSAERVVIATEDPSLKAFAEGFGAEAILTSADCLTGTDRVAEAAQKFPNYSIFFNLQGDAVLTPSWVIEEVLQTMLQDDSILVATPAVRLENKALDRFILNKEKNPSSGTTVVFDRKKRALYFSKAVLPQGRDGRPREVWQHIGLYGYRKNALFTLSRLSEGSLEKIEKLEQLRALENEIPIQIVEVDYRNRSHASVDHPEDIAIVESLIAKEGELV